MDLVNMSLEDVIKAKKPSKGSGDKPAKSSGKSEAGGRGGVGGRAQRGGGRGVRGGRRGGRGGRGRGSRSGGYGGGYGGGYSDGYSGGRGDDYGGPSAGQIVVGRRIYVGNLSFNLGWQDLKDIFREAGEVVYADVIMRAGRSRGCGIVEFDSPESAAWAIQNFQNVEIDGRPIFVREDREDSDLVEAGYGFRDRGRDGREREHVRESDGRTVYVGNLSWDTAEDGLLQHMSSVGKVIEATIMTRRDGKSKGSAVVKYQSVKAASAAIDRLMDTKLDGRQIFVREYTD